MGSPLDIRRQLTISLLCFKMGAGTYLDGSWLSMPLNVEVSGDGVLPFGSLIPRFASAPSR